MIELHIEFVIGFVGFERGWEATRIEIGSGFIKMPQQLTAEQVQQATKAYITREIKEEKWTGFRIKEYKSKVGERKVVPLQYRGNKGTHYACRELGLYATIRHRMQHWYKRLEWAGHCDINYLSMNGGEIQVRNGKRYWVRKCRGVVFVDSHKGVGNPPSTTVAGVMFDFFKSTLQKYACPMFMYCMCGIVWYCVVLCGIG